MSNDACRQADCGGKPGNCEEQRTGVQYHVLIGPEDSRVCSNVQSRMSGHDPIPAPLLGLVKSVIGTL